MDGIPQKYIIPHRLDDPPKFLWWDFDVAILAMGCLMIGIMINQPMTFGGLGTVEPPTPSMSRKCSNH